MYRHQLETTLRDLQHGVRVLRDSPAFTVTAVLSLALALGAATAIFSLVNAVLLKPLPVRAPEELVLLGERGRAGGPREVLSWSLNQFRALREAESLSGLCAFRPQLQFTVTRPGGTELTSGQLVSGNCFELFGLSAQAGRLLTTDDETAGESRPVVVISDDFWRRVFDANPNVIGQAVPVKGRFVTVVGVTPRGFYGFEPGRTVDVTAPLSLRSWFMPGPALANPDVRWLRLIGRLSPGVSRAQAEPAMSARWQAIPRPRPNAPASDFMLLSGVQGLSDLRTQFSLALRLLLGAVGLLLLIACVNLASLLIARGRVREQEMTVRLALGAGRGRIVRQLLTESLLLSLLGGAAGLIVATWSSHAIVALLSRGRSPIAIDLSVDGRLLLFTLALVLAANVCFGVWPAIVAARVDLQARLRNAARTLVGAGRRRTSLLIAAQTACSIVLIVAAGLFARSLTKLQDVGFGRSTSHVTVVNVNPGAAGESGVRAGIILRDFHARLAATPGIDSVSHAMDLPFRGASYTAGVGVAGAPPVDSVVFNFVGPAFFRTLGVPMLAGRDFAAGDLGAGLVAVISQSLASHYFAGRNAVGERLEIGGASVEIIGVVRDVPYARVRSERELVVYRPYAHEPRVGVPGTFVLRTSLPPAALLTTVRGALREVAPGVPLGSVVKFDSYFDGSIATERLLASIAAFFGVMALLLIAVGVYGTLASLVVQRSTEFRVRLALGATGERIARLVVASALIPVAIGLTVGLPIALAVTRMAESTLFGVTSRDPVTYAGSVAALLSIALLAAAIPARKAARADAVGSLRVE